MAAGFPAQRKMGYAAAPPSYLPGSLPRQKWSCPTDWQMEPPADRSGDVFHVQWASWARGRTGPGRGPPRRKPLWGTVWHEQPQRDRRTALMMGFFYMCRKLWGGQHWDALSIAHWAIFNLKTNKIICAGLTIHNKAGPAAVQTYEDEASIVVNSY